MANYLLGVRVEDSFRYKLIDERSIEINIKDDSQSKTNGVNEYYIRGFNGNLYIVVDTPGFLDTKGVNRDIITTSQIKEFFEKSLD